MRCQLATSKQTIPHLCFWWVESICYALDKGAGLYSDIQPEDVSADFYILLPCHSFTVESNRTHCRLCPTRYSFTPESSEACEGKVPCTGTQCKGRNMILH